MGLFLGRQGLYVGIKPQAMAELMGNGKCWLERSKKTTRMIEDCDIRRRRASYRAHHRGTKEMDWILGRFAMAELAAMLPAQLAAFEELLALPDPLLQDMILDPAALPAGEFKELITQLRAFHGLLPTPKRGSAG